ncbi:NAD(P)-dependent alcohol dehydrogenase [Aspergillus tubingensis]|uniref:Alcohol dehydrogenase n=1 Tax=Aspergillus niger TaxID=5061 RepID=A0A117E385_ASPNG|nr:alcohol dehydrogenase [Aspergillus tubingensis]GAQ44827.1 alcohol dehydrogenase [Aspergillus niger]GFN11769.1 alcohol dehydrogenase [Aspergillus tubingensis]
MTHILDVYRASPSGQIYLDHITRQLSPDEALVEVTHASICGTDSIYLHSQQVLGHEGIGIVRAIGADVRSVRIGDRVGMGYVQKTCGDCQSCTSGWDQYCQRKDLYGMSDPDRGCLGFKTIWNANALIPIPDGLHSGDAAALMCGGATVWTVLSRYGMQPRDRVGVLGIGGMGHLAIKMAAALGYHVVAFSGSESKKADCLAFGAKEYYLTNGKSMEDMEPLKHLLLCGSSSEDYTFILSLLAVHGTVYPLTVSLQPAAIRTIMLINKGLRIQGSLVASRGDLAKMLQFCADKGVRPATSNFSLTSTEEVNQAMESLQRNTVRYKALLVADEHPLKL